MRTVLLAYTGVMLLMLTARSQQQISPEEAREAYIYAYPIVQNYLSIYQFALDPKGSQYKGPPNEVHNVARLFTPADTGVITPNSDTPYSFLILDLRAEPILVTLPEIEKNRYYSLQLVDLYTNNVDYLGTRNDGNGGGHFLIAGPDWNGVTPAGIKRVVRISTQLAFSQFRTQLFDPSDIDAVKKIQSGYKAEPLSAYLNQTPTSPPAKIDYPPISATTFEPQFWQYANFLLQFCPPLESEKELRAKFARIGVEGGRTWPPAGTTRDIMDAIEAGRQEGRKSIEQALLKTKTSVGLFGTPQQMAGKYMERAVGAMGGIYGNSTEETIYPSYQKDESGQRFDTSKFNYTLTFGSGQLPPVNAFWSVTMYDADTKFLVENPLKRYLINSPMLSSLKKDADGVITLYLQHSSPGVDKESNWLPAPDGPMAVVMRLYLPKREAVSGKWIAPPIGTAGPVERQQEQQHPASVKGSFDSSLSAEEAREIASDFYVYSYPFVLQELSRRQSVNVERPGFPYSPMGQFAHARQFFPADSKIIVRPNVDTLYSTAWIDTGPEPVVLSVPSTDRYFVLPLHSMWSDQFASIGTRTNGPNHGGNYLIVSPNWQGKPPSDMRVVRSPTRYVVILGRTKASGPSDYDDVHKVQDAIRLTPLSGWGKSDYEPPEGEVDPTVDMKTPPPALVDRMTPAEYLDVFTSMWGDNPPGQYDYPILFRAARLGIENGQQFDTKSAPLALQQALDAGFKDGRAKIAAENEKVSGGTSPDWVYTTRSGAYGVDYLYRAGIAASALGQLLAEDAVYPSLAADSEGRPLDGKHKYVLHFDKGKLPPVNGFWSVTAYDREGYFIPNPINRFVVRDRDPLTTNADGSTDIYIQPQDPGPGKNWLPSGNDPFTLMLRVYSPKPDFLDGTWKPPRLKRLD